MKKCFTLILLSVAIITGYSCTKEKTEVKAEEPKVNKDLSPFIELFPLRVTEAYRHIGNDSINLLADTIIRAYRDAVCLTFQEGNVYFYSSSRITNTKFPPHAQTFSLNTKIRLPTNLKYHWDEKKGTMIVRSSGLSSYFPIIPDAREAYLDTTGVLFHKTLEEARNATKPGQIRFIFNDVDPNLGAVKYSITMRPLWFYERDEIALGYQRFVMF